MRRRLLPALGFLLCLAACDGAAGAGDDGAPRDVAPDVPEAPGTLVGQVVRAGTLAPLPGATVHLVADPLSTATPGAGPADSGIAPAVTGRDGRFRLEGVPPGSWLLQVARTGHRDTPHPVAVIPGAETAVEIALDPVPVTGDACVACHGDANALLRSLADDPPPVDPEAPEVLGECCGGSVPDIPAHERVLLTMDYAEDDHFRTLACQDCHAGDPSGTTRAQAHAGLVADPTADGGGACRSCHAEIVARARQSGHFTLSGKRGAIARRAGVTGEMPQPLKTAFDRHCNTCHATCGDCHVAVPGDAGGGLLKGHAIVKTPPDHLTCVGCHGTRVRDEFQGRNAGRPADIHFEVGRMTCPDCHRGDQMHGAPLDDAGRPGDTVPLAPACADCHPDDATFRAVPAHGAHRAGGDGPPALSCQACHAVEYKHCFACHVALDDAGRKTHEVNAATNHLSVIAFRIGRNAEPDARHPEDWVTVRHVPAAPDTFAFYGDALLPDFDVDPTWRRAAPHTIRRTTPRTAAEGSCAAGCHGVREAFLGPDDTPANEAAANADVTVAVPPGGPVP